MIVYPAIDLKDGACVRLRRGEMSDATIFNPDPAGQARAFAAAGAEWLHIVDLNGAFAGKSVNGAAVEAILGAVDLPCQVGGGIRDPGAVAGWLDRGVARIILGTAALVDPDLVKASCRRHPGRIAVALDARGGRVAVEGWARTSEVTALELALRFEDSGAAAIVHTDIDRDGLLAGANVAATAALAEALTTPVIASGGIASLDDLRLLKAAEPSGIAGVVIGRALYDRRIDLAAALALMSGG